MLKDLRIYNIRTMSDIKIRNYNKSKIYKIYCEDEGVDEIYVGSTVDLKTRVRNHKSACNNINDEFYNKKLYIYIRNNFGFDNFTVKTLERFSCENEIQLRTREQEWINELKPTLNDIRARTTKLEAKELRKKRELITNYEKKYYQENKSEIRKKAKEIMQCTNCDKQHTRQYKSIHMKSKYCLNYTAV
jgi:hypothetical protein